MNGLIQHLATSGLDLSEDNVLGIEYAPNLSIFTSPDLPDDFYILSYFGYFFLDSDYYWNDCWEIAIFQCDKINRSIDKIKSISHQNGTGYKIDIYIDFSLRIRGRAIKPDGIISQNNSIPYLLLKSI